MSDLFRVAFDAANNEQENGKRGKNPFYTFQERDENDSYDHVGILKMMHWK